MISRCLTTFFVFFLLTEGIGIRAQSPEPFSRKGKWGVKANELILLPARYDTVLAFESGLAQVRRKKKWGLIRKDGSWAHKPSFSALGKIGSNFIAAQNRKTRLWGYLNKDGTLMLPCAFDSAGTFVGKVAFVRKPGERLQLIQKDGTPLISDITEAELFSFGRTRIAVEQGGKMLHAYIDTAGNRVTPLCRTNFRLGSKPVEVMRDFPLSYAVLSQSGSPLTGWVDELKRLPDGRYIFREGRKWGVFSPQYKRVFTADYDEIDYRRGAIVGRRGRYSEVLDEGGKPASPAFVNYLEFPMGLGVGELPNGLFLLIDIYGKKIGGPYREISEFIAGSALVIGPNPIKQYNFINRQGRELWNWTLVPSLRFSPAEEADLFDEMILAKKVIRKATGSDAPLKMLSLMGKREYIRRIPGTVLPNGNLIISVSQGTDTLQLSEGTLITDQPKFGLLNRFGRTIIPVEWEAVGAISDSSFAAKKDGKWGMLDFEGKLISPYQSDSQDFPDKSLNKPRIPDQE